jgi:endoglucanase
LTRYGSQSAGRRVPRPSRPTRSIQCVFKRVDWVIEQAVSRKLAAVINIHHYVDMEKDPVNNFPRLLALWKQIAVRYRDWPDNLFFELFNEPNDGLNDER